MADLVENITEVNELIFGDLSVPQSRVEALLVKNTNAIKELADILEHIATIETDDTSTHHYEIGEYIIYDGRIYQTLKEINIGDTFEIDVNIKQVVFGDELEGVNDLLEKIKEMFGPVEDGDKASKDYKIGDYVVYKNKLYKVIQNISNGDTFVTEVNIEETTLNEVFNTLIEIIPESSTTKPGLMSAEDKIKLDGIEANANKYTHPAYTARTGVPTANQAPGFGGTFTVTQPVSDSQGHITQMNSRTITMPSATATTTAAGLMSAADKSKLNGVSSANLVPAGGSSGQVLKRDSNGNLTWGTDNNTTYSVATTSANGLMSSTDKSKLDGITSSNLVPSGGSAGQVLKLDSNKNLVWGTDNNTTYSVATTSANGLMSSTDKSKLDGLKSYSVATTTADGLMSAADKSKLDSALTSSNLGSYRIKSALLGGMGSNGVVTFASGWSGTAYYLNGFLVIGASISGAHIYYGGDSVLATISGAFTPSIGWVYGFMSVQFNDGNQVVPIDFYIGAGDGKWYIRTFTGFVPWDYKGKSLIGKTANDSRYTIICPGSYNG